MVSRFWKAFVKLGPWHRSKKRVTAVTGNRKKMDFPQKKLAENAKSVKFALPALPCRTNIVISPKIWPVIAWILYKYLITLYIFHKNALLTPNFHNFDDLSTFDAKICRCDLLTFRLKSRIRRGIPGRVWFAFTSLALHKNMIQCTMRPSPCKGVN